MRLRADVSTADGLRLVASGASRQSLSRSLSRSLTCITIRVNLEVTDDAVGVSVQDEGDGIPPETVPRLFDRFYRTDAARHDGVPGSGLGFAICNGLVDARGGQIGVE